MGLFCLDTFKNKLRLIFKVKLKVYGVVPLDCTSIKNTFCAKLFINKF